MYNAQLLEKHKEFLERNTKEQEFEEEFSLTLEATKVETPDTVKPLTETLEIKKLEKQKSRLEKRKK
jgi:hypothetical protein